jgi:hypothetical protein
MGFNGSGVFQRVRNWVADATAGIKIRADYHDAEDDGFAAGLSNCITKDGQTLITQNIPFNSKRITGLADPVNPQDAATKASIPSLVSGVSLPVTGGTINGDLTVSGNTTVSGILTATTIKASIVESGSYWLDAGHQFGMTWDGVETLFRGGTTAFYFQNGAANTNWAFIGPTGITTYGAINAATAVIGGMPCYGGIPSSNVGNGYVTVADDAQKHLWGTGGLTINGALYPIGTCISFLAWGGNLVISNTENQYAFANGTTITGARTLAHGGMATAIRFAGGYWAISGNGLT